MHAYVINLARSRDRRAYITAELAKTGADYEFVSAVDGQQLDLGDRSLIDPSFVTNIIYPPGTAGTALSHLSVYQKIITDGLPAGLVLEDDICLPGDLVALADAVGSHLTGAEVALFSVDSPEPCQMSTEGAIPLPGSRFLALPVDISQPRSGGAYVITREACERMVKSLLPIRIQADMWWSFYRDGVIDRVRCVTPLPVLKSPSFSSTIGSYSLNDGLRARMIAPLMRRKIPGLHQALAYRRKRILRDWGQSVLTDAPFIEKPSRLD